jgi:hypothetical protein
MNIQTAISTTMKTTIKTLSKTAMTATQEVAKAGVAGAAVAVELVKRARNMSTGKGMQIDASAIATQGEAITDVPMSFEEAMMDTAATAEMQEEMSAELSEDASEDAAEGVHTGAISELPGDTDVIEG